MKDILHMHPALGKAYSRNSTAPLENCYIGTLLGAKRDVDVDFGLTEVNSVVEGLLTRFSLDELANNSPNCS